MDLHPEFPNGEKKIPFNDRHNPSHDFTKFDLADDVYILWRPGTPEERKMGALTRPDGEMVQYPYAPNCGMVVAAGKNCKRAIGDYVFWTYAGKDSEKPMPVVFDFMDAPPTVFFLQEKFVLFSVPPSTEVPEGELPH